MEPMVRSDGDMGSQIAQTNIELCWLSHSDVNYAEGRDKNEGMRCDIQRQKCPGQEALDAFTAMAFGPRPAGSMVNIFAFLVRTTATSPERASTTKSR